jgi:hypothetical protein
VVYARMTDRDFPFVQKRFFEEYAAWAEVESVESSKLSAEPLRLQLVAKSMALPRKTEPDRAPVVLEMFKAKVNARTHD